MTRSFPREVVMLVPLQLEAVCMQNAMLKESLASNVTVGYV